MTLSTSASHVEPWFIGCACDRRFVEHTAVMLTSISINGDVPDATIVVAGFGLNAEDLKMLRAGAHRIADRIKFIDVDPNSLQGLNLGWFTESYPPSVLGRLFIANGIVEANARLLTIDSDMIVNTSLRPLFELDLGSEFFAAIHDPPRRHDLNYFNSGLMLTDVETYKHHDIAKRSLQWLANQSDHPTFPDQDALNAIIGDLWHRLDRSWNFFFFENEKFTLEGYEGAKIAHFAGPKPWNYADHPGAPLYNRYLSKLRARLDKTEAQKSSFGRDFIATCYEVFLGRSLEDEVVVRDRAHWPKTAIVRSIIQSSEFQDNVLKSLRERTPFPEGIFIYAPTIRQRFWMADRLAMQDLTRARVEAAESWKDILVALFQDVDFINAYGAAEMH